MTSLDRAALRRAILAAYPWVDEPEVGPRAVDAGECDRCGTAPRLVPTCGPVPWPALCRDCVAAVGGDAWCAGHAAAGERWLDWAAGLPSEWGDVVRVWWIATGEVRLSHGLLERAGSGLAPSVRALVAGTTRG